MALGEIYSFGEVKYGRNNWANGTDWHQFQGSLLRHYLRWASGEDIDPESGKHHLLHTIWNAITLWFYQQHALGNDDRISSVLHKTDDELLPVYDKHGRNLVGYVNSGYVDMLKKELANE